MTGPHKYGSSSWGNGPGCQWSISGASNESIWASHQSAMLEQSSLLEKKSHPPSSFSPSTTQPQQCKSACTQNIPMNYLCALEPKLTRNMGTVQKGCRQWGSAANYVLLSVSNAVTSARGEGSSPVFLLKRRMEENKQTRVWEHT